MILHKGQTPQERAAAEEQIRQSAVADSIKKFAGLKDPELVQQLARGAIDTPSTESFEQIMAGWHINYGCEKQFDRAWQHEGEGLKGATIGRSFDFQKHYDNVQHAKNMGMYDKHSTHWKKMGHGGRHVMSIPREAVTIFKMRYGFDPTDNILEAQRIAKTDPFVAAWFTNEA